MFKKASFILILLLIGAIGYSREREKPDKNIEPFNPNEITGQVSHHRIRRNKRFEPKTDDELPEDEFLIDTCITYLYSPEPYEQYNPSVAFDGSNYLVVWEDYRNEPFAYSDIYGVRVNQSGEIIDLTEIAISTAADDQYSPSVAFDGTNYFVVWQDYRSYNQWDIYCTRVNPSGVVLDTNGLAISTDVSHQMFPSIAFDGTNFLVVWEDYRNSFYPDIYGARVNQSSVVIDTNGFAISTAIGNQFFPSIAFDDTNYLVVWEDHRNGSYPDIYGARVDQSGVVLDTAGIAISTATRAQNSPSVAFDGDNYFVVWADYRNGFYSDVYGARVNKPGVVLDPNGITISTATYYQYSPSVTFDGTNYFVVWTDFRNNISYSDMFGARVNQSGVVLDPNGIPISISIGGQYNPSVAFDGSNYFVFWEHEQADIFGTRVNQSGIILDTSDILISTLREANSQNYPSVAFDGTNYLVVWQDNRNDDLDIYAIRVNQSGVAIDTNAIAVSRAAYSSQSNPSILFGGTNYLVVWTDTNVYGARVNQSGMILDTNSIPISIAVDDQDFPSGAFDGSNYFVVWQDKRNGYDFDIYGARVNQSGVVLDPDGTLIATGSNHQGLPSLAFDGTNYLVVWTDQRSGPDDIYCARVTQFGVVLDTNGIAISTAERSQRCPSVDFDGTNCLVVWEDSRNGFSSEIYGARVNPSGVVIDTNGIPISETRYYWLRNPCVAFDSANYFVLWDRAGDIYGAVVNLSGMVIDSFPVSTQPGLQTYPALSRGSGNQVLITYSGWTDSINHHSTNTMRIWGKFYPFVGIDDENSKVKMQSAKLLESAPNPFRNKTSIKYSTTKVGDISLKIYDISGRIVRNLFDGFQKSGVYTVNWNGTDDFGRKLPAGVYFYRLERIEGITETKELIILR